MYAVAGFCVKSVLYVIFGKPYIKHGCKSI
jgi:hypothetical protein